MKILLNIICILIPFLGFGQGVAQNFELGNKAYENGEFENAISHYTQIVDQHFTSFELHYNLGNSYFKTEQIGKAILHFEKAFKLNTEDEDLQFNLNLCRNYIVDQIEELPRPAVLKWWISFKEKSSPNTWAKFALLTVGIFSFILIVRIFTTNRSVKKTSIVLGFISLVLSIFFLSMSYISDMAVKKEAILIHTNTNIKNSPSENGADIFILHEGVKMQVLEELNGWKKIKLSNGMVGWLPMQDIAEI